MKILQDTASIKESSGDIDPFDCRSSYNHSQSIQLRSGSNFLRERRLELRMGTLESFVSAKSFVARDWSGRSGLTLAERFAIFFLCSAANHSAADCYSSVDSWRCRR